jgi:hypothetical protein
MSTEDKVCAAIASERETLFLHAKNGARAQQRPAENSSNSQVEQTSFLFSEL